jgi:23S rRNA (adenine2503-C2)-methyltransferase
MSADRQRNLFGLDRDELSGVVEQLGERPYRAGQLFEWLYARRVDSIEAMSNLSRPLRDRLARDFCVSRPAIGEQSLSYDGTRKFLFRLEDGASVEAVYIPEQKRRTICISTQAGCPLKCGFCLTGIAGFTRNLTPGEILGQVAAIVESAPAPGRPGEPRPWNVVVMGMGEPLLNADATFAALRVLMDPKGFAVPPRKLTLSTVGILPALERLMREPVRPSLAISLHAANPELRRRLMPIEEKYPMREVVAAALRYPNPRGGRVTFEYVLLSGVNDSPRDARDLAALLGSSRGKVNLIPLNAAPQIPFEAPSAAAVDAFCGVLVNAGVRVSVRRSRGRDVLAACGQLHLDRARVVPHPSSRFASAPFA